MPVRRAPHKTHNKIHNKKLRRRREGLSSKAYEYGELDGVELALFIRYPKRGDFYSYLSGQHLPWIHNVHDMMSHPKAKNERPEDVKGRVEMIKTRQKTASHGLTLGEGEGEGASGQEDEQEITVAALVATFPDPPTLELTILKGRHPARLPLPRGEEQGELPANSAQKGEGGSACSSDARLGRRLVGWPHPPPAAISLAVSAVSRRSLKAAHRGLEHIFWSKRVFIGAVCAREERRLQQSKHGSIAALMARDATVEETLQALIAGLGDPRGQQPSLFVLVGNREKTTAMRTLFGIRGSRRYKIRYLGEVHVHLDPSTALLQRPLLVASCDTRDRCQSWSDARGETCHGARRHWLWRPFARENAADEAHARILSPFADVFCFFAADIGGLRLAAKRVAGLLMQSSSPWHLNRTLPSMVVATDALPCRAEAETEALTDFLRMVEEETAIDPYQHFSSLEIVAVLPRGAVSPDTRYLHLKERVMARSDQVRSVRREARMLFSASHLAALLQGAGERFASSLDAPCDPVQMSRLHNPVAEDLSDHLSAFLRHVRSSAQLTEFAAPMVASTLVLDSYAPGAHVFECRTVFDTLYRSAFHKTSGARVMALQESGDVVLQSGLVRMVERHFARFFDKLVGGAAAGNIHRDNLAAFRDRWKDIQSSGTCLCCLRRQPQYCLPCGHCFCENCVAVFGDGRAGLQHCILCWQEMPNAVTVRMHPPTPPAVRKRIQPRTNVSPPVPLQRFVKVALGVGIGAVVAMGHCINGGRPFGESIEKIPELIARRMPPSLAFVSRAYQLAMAHGAAGLCLARSMELVLSEVLGANKRNLACPSMRCSSQHKSRFGVPRYVPFFHRLLYTVDGPRASSNARLSSLEHMEAAEAPDSEPGSRNYKPSTDSRRSVRSVIGRAVGLVPEKSQIWKTAVLAGKLLHRYHPAWTQKMDRIVRCLLASLFYFELDPLSQQRAALLQRVTGSGSCFLVNGWPLSSAGPCLGGDGRFCLQVRTESEDRLTISLELDGTGPCNISGSPFSVQGLANAQGRHAAAGRANRKRKKLTKLAMSPQKRRKGTGSRV
ncbi:putative patatin-like phospholipase [Stemphylium lycopersici]|nr:putative patatin-like phospholipase [Stemphylium lycopersici]